MVVRAVGHGPRDANAAGRAPCESGRGIEPAPAGYSLQLPPNRIDGGALAGEIDRREAAHSPRHGAEAEAEALRETLDHLSSALHDVGGG